MSPAIRPETPADEAAIEAITRAAFLVHPHSRQTEQFIIRELRTAGALSVSLVAEEGGRVVGHIAFSLVSLADGAPGWYGMGPVSVATDRQRRGIGGALVEAGLARLRQLGAQGCLLVGDPAFYGRFGFAQATGLELEGVPAEVFLALSFGPSLPTGRVDFHPAFAAEA
jgi:putative acetyltransferase